MATLRKLQFVPGRISPDLLDAPRVWFRQPGSYVEERRGMLTYYLVPKDGTPKMVSRDEAEQAAREELTPEQDAADGHLKARADRERDPDAAPAGLSNPYPSALDCLRAHPGTDFGVHAERIYRQAPDGSFQPVDGYRLVARDDTRAVLHAASDAYEEVSQAIPLSLLDAEATEGRIAYRYAWASSDLQRVRGVGSEVGKNVVVNGRRVGIRFDVPGVSSRIAGLAAGGTLVTSHDGSTAIRATACLTLAGVTVFHTNTHSWRHSSKVEDRLKQSRATLLYLARAASGLVRDAEACVRVPAAEAADTVLRAVAPELYEEAPALGEEGARTPEERQEWIEEQTNERARCLQRLHETAGRFWGELGGLRFVLAAPYSRSNRAPRERSYYDGSARERISAALVALARHAGVAEAGMVPASVPSALVDDAARMLGAGGGAS